MWEYKEITRNEFERRKDFVESILRKMRTDPTDLGQPHLVSSYANHIQETMVSNRTVFKYKNGYYRVAEILFPKKPFIVVEYADKVDDVKRNVMIDADPFPYDLCDDEIAEEIRILLCS